MNGEINVVFNYSNTLRKKLVHNKTKAELQADVGVYEIPCGECNLRYFGESGRGLQVRLVEHKRDYNKLAQNNVLVKHSWNRDHRINWNAAKIIHRSTEIGVRRLVEGAAIKMGNSVEGNKTITQKDKFVDKMVSNIAFKDFSFSDNGSDVAPDAVAAVAVSRSNTHIAILQVASTASDAHLPPTRDTQIQVCNNNASRRSRRLAGLPSENDGIT